MPKPGFDMTSALEKSTPSLEDLVSTFCTLTGREPPTDDVATARWLIDNNTPEARGAKPPAARMGAAASDADGASLEEVITMYRSLTGREPPPEDVENARKLIAEATRTRTRT